jgi:PadR family transcriptional regulator PadR
MKGYLEFLVLSLLQKQDLSGYKIIKSIGSALGKDPSAGSIYPILIRLSKEGSLNVRVSGREKEYSITKKGAERVAEIEQEQKEFIGNVHKMIFSGTGKFHEDAFHSTVHNTMRMLPKIKPENKKEALEILRNAENKLRRLLI